MEATPNLTPETPTVELRVFRHGNPVHRQLCVDEDEAGVVMERWSELDGIRFEVDGLTVGHRPGEVFEPEPSDLEDPEVDEPQAGDDELVDRWG